MSEETKKALQQQLGELSKQAAMASKTIAAADVAIKKMHSPSELELMDINLTKLKSATEEGEEVITSLTLNLP